MEVDAVSICRDFFGASHFELLKVPSESVGLLQASSRYGSGDGGRQVRLIADRGPNTRRYGRWEWNHDGSEGTAQEFQSTHSEVDEVRKWRQSEHTVVYVERHVVLSVASASNYIYSYC